MFKNIVLIVLTFSLVSCTCKQKQESGIVNEVPKIVIELVSVEDVENLTSDVQLIDVRTPAEYKEGYIKNAKNINFYDDDFLSQMSKLNKRKPVYIYCKSGGRSGKATTQLKEAGFTKIYDLKGGITQWTSERKTISK